MATIRLTEALKVMETGSVFSIEFVTYDKKRKTGGIIKKYPEAILLSKSDSADDKKKDISTSIKSTTKKRKNPNHFDNATRNIKVLINGRETSGNRKIHIFLITKFNGKRVYL